VADGSNRPVRILLTLRILTLRILTVGTLTLGTGATAMLATVPAVHAEPRPTISQVERRVGELYHAAEQATERYNDARIALADAERRFGQAQSRVATQQAELARKQAVIGAIAASAYRSGGVDESLKVLLADDPKQFLARASALRVLSQRQAQSVHEAQLARQELEAQKAAAARKLAAVEKWRRELATEKATVERNLRSAQEQLNNLRAEERRRLAEERARQAEARRLAEERRRLAERASRNQQQTSPARRSSGGRQSGSPPAPVSGRAGEAVNFARAQLGDRYVYGAAGPDAWDCSGLTMMAWRAGGVSLPHSSSAQYSAGTHVSRSQLQPGDLVFFYSPISHVGIYIGGGDMIHAPNPSERVQISPISQMPYAGATRP